MSLLFRWDEALSDLRFVSVSVPAGQCLKSSSLLFFFADCSPSFRVDADCISPDVKNSIHVGDRILEINGTPIHNVPLDEVLATRCAFSDEQTASNFHPSCHFTLRPSWFIPRLQIDLLIQETSRLLQLTIEHDPHSQGLEGGSSEAEEQTDGPLPTPLSEGPSPILPITQPPNPDINSLRSRIIT